MKMKKLFKGLLVAAMALTMTLLITQVIKKS